MPTFNAGEDALELATDALTKTGMPHLVGQDVDTTEEHAFLRFEGDAAPTAFAGEGRSSVWSLEALYAPSEHARAKELLDLLVQARDAADRRLVFTPAGGRVAGIDVATTVEVPSWKQQRQSGGFLRISFTATEVVS